MDFSEAVEHTVAIVLATGDCVFAVSEDDRVVEASRIEFW